ncbi:MAG: histidinol dehydrogenase [Dehalococcoidia bacterium]|nr:MAG: histidinol dehydrogenase [Dehalococcoidia bacterium]
MIKVEGFGKAKQLLTRKASFQFLDLSPELRSGIRHVFGEELSPQAVVERIINEVRDKGDEALFHYTKVLDGVELDSLEVRREDISAAYDAVDGELISALKLAADRTRAFHLAVEPKRGIAFVDKYLGRQIQPLDKVGLYIPGGTAAYPSTVLMTAIPAKVAGVNEIVMVSPPNKNGDIPAPTLVAGDIAQVNHIFKVGGAQAVAALAFGTESIPRVDKICGPGNIFVTLAKKMVYGVVDIDGLEGPSEIMIVADEKADASFCAADLLAQAEHDPMAAAILVTTSSELAERVDREIEAQLKGLKRCSIAAQAINKGIIVLVDNVGEAIELVNVYAPEHLSLMVADASSLVSRVQNAGCIFVGEDSPVVLGDYVAGPSHVLPTGGSARFSSPLGVEDFLKVSNVVALDKSIMEELSGAAITMARAEGLDAHAQAMALRARGSDLNG